MVTDETEAEPLGIHYNFTYTAIPVKNEDETIIGAMELLQDVTDEKAQQNMQTIFNTIPYALLVITDGVFVETNTAAEHLFKTDSRDDLIGKPLSILSPPHQADGRSSEEIIRSVLLVSFLSI